MDPDSAASGEMKSGELETGHRRLLEEIRESESRLASLLSSLPGMAYRCRNDPAWTMEFVSAGCRELTGWSAEDLLENRQVAYADLIHPDDRQKVWADVQAGVREKRVFRLNYRIRAADGTEKWVWEQGRGLFAAEGGLVALQGFIADVTERRRLLEEVRSSREFLDGVLKSIQDGISVLAPDLTIRHVNPVMNSWYRKNLPLEGKKCFQVYHNGRGPCDPCPTLRCLETGRTEREEVPGLPGSAAKWLELFCYPIKDPVSGEITGVVEFVRDITERRRTEQELRREHAQVLSIFDSIEQVIYVADMDTYEVVFANRFCRQALGKDPVGQLCHRSFQGLDKPCEFCTNEIIRKLDYRPYAWEFFNSKLGRHYQLVDRVIRWPDGRDLRFELAIDISGIKKAEEERFAIERRLQQAQKLEGLGVLAGGIAHDFNNILMAVLGHAELALDEISPLSPARQNLREIALAARRAGDLCRQMLAYSGKASFAHEPIRLKELIEEMVHLLQISISKKAVLNLRLDPGLPPVMGDPSQARQVVMNLILNASESLGDKSGVVTVSTGAVLCDEACLRGMEIFEDLAPGLYLWVEVADTGCGMDRETRARLFKPFFSTKFTGRGLGLAAVLGIMRAHQGAIKVYSEPGKGTSFRVYFPVSEKLEESAGSGEDSASAWRGSGTILLVDDEETLRALGTRMLERLGFSVLTASDGEEALEIYRRRGREIALVLLDLTMPRMDGAETFAELRRLDPSVKVVMASGYGAKHVAEQFAGRNLDGVVQKPYPEAELRAVLARILG